MCSGEAARLLRRGKYRSSWFRDHFFHARYERLGLLLTRFVIEEGEHGEVGVRGCLVRASLTTVLREYSDSTTCTADPIYRAERDTMRLDVERYEDERRERDGNSRGERPRR